MIPLTVKRHLSYGAHPLQQMDVHLPADHSPQSPVVFLIHGGGFIMGRKEDFEIPAQLFSKEGFVTVNLSHRLIDANWFHHTGTAQKDGIKISDQLEDVDDAIHYYKRHCVEWGCGQERLYIAGHSAGGVLGMLYILQEGDREGIRASGNWAGITDFTMPTDVFSGFLQPWQRQHVQSMYDKMLDYSALIGNTGDVRDISPYWLADKFGGKPIISLYPENNVVLGVPGEAALGLMQTKRFHAMLRSQGVPEKFSLYAGCNHSFSGSGNDTWQRAVHETADFFRTN